MASIIETKDIEKVFFFDVTKKGTLSSDNDIVGLENEYAIYESMYNILLTEPGERVMDPEFGTALRKFLFTPIDYNTAISIVKEIETSLTRNEPRLDDVEINVSPSYDENTYYIQIIGYFSNILGQKNIEISLDFKKIR